MNRIPARTAAALLALLVVLSTRPDTAAWSSAVAGLRGAGPAPSVDGLAALVAGAALWVLAGWVLLVLAAGRLAAAPGALGAAGRGVVRLTVPPALRGLVLRGLVSGGVAGGLLLGPVAAATAATPVWPTSPAASTSVGTPGPAWPTSPAAPTTPAAPAPTTSSDPAAPSAPATPTQTTPTPATPAVPAPTGPTPAAGSATGVVVAPGDSLWSIAATDLRRHGAAADDAAVAAAWPAWFAANRAVVGADPGLLHPGTHLTAPPVTPTPTPTPTDGSTP